MILSKLDLKENFSIFIPMLLFCKIYIFLELLLEIRGLRL